MKSLLFTALLLLGFTSSLTAQHEYAPLQEKELKYRDWTYKSVRDGAPINLRDFAKDKKLVMIVYLAAWCPNWRNEAPFAQRLYDKYRADGLAVVGVGEYATIEETKTSLDNLKITFPVVAESDSREAKKKTPHYEYRRKTGDARNWGSPWNIFLEPANLRKDGDVLLKKAFIVNGELIEDETEKFVRQKLGLPTATEKKTDTAKTGKAIEVCEPDKKTADFKKP